LGAGALSRSLVGALEADSELTGASREDSTKDSVGAGAVKATRPEGRDLGAGGVGRLACTIAVGTAPEIGDSPLSPAGIADLAGDP